MQLSRYRVDERGFSLVELLVVVLVLGVIGGITLTGLVQGLRTGARADARIEAFTDLQRAAERVSRDLRRGIWTDTFVTPAAPAGCTYLDLAPDALSLIIFESGVRYQHQYQVTAGVLRLSRSTWNGTTWQPAGTQEVVRGLTNGTNAEPVFTYLDADGGDLLADGKQNVDRGRVRKFGLRFETDIPNHDGVAEVRTVVGARNGGLSCPSA